MGFSCGIRKAIIQIYTHNILMLLFFTTVQITLLLANGLKGATRYNFMATLEHCKITDRYMCVDKVKKERYR